MSLEEVWNEATKNLSRTVADEWWTKILEKYNEDGRNYHDFLHLEEKIQHFNSVKHVLKDPDAVALAIIFHYYEYDPKAVECEIKNCEHFSKFADESGIPKESPLHSGVIELLQAAATHSTDAHKTEGLYGSDDLHYFLDFDMAVLGSEPEHYKEYTAKVQQEYAFLPDSMYKSLRLKVRHYNLVTSAAKLFNIEDRITTARFLRAKYHSIPHQQVLHSTSKMEQDLRVLTRKRDFIRRKFTLIQKYCDSISEEVNVFRFKAEYDYLNELWNKFEGVQIQIESLIEAEDDMDFHVQYYEETRNNYQVLKAKLSGLLFLHEQQVHSASPVNSEQSQLRHPF